MKTRFIMRSLNSANLLLHALCDCTDGFSAPSRLHKERPASYFADNSALIKCRAHQQN